MSDDVDKAVLFKYMDAPYPARPDTSTGGWRQIRDDEPTPTEAAKSLVDLILHKDHKTILDMLNRGVGGVNHNTYLPFQYSSLKLGIKYPHQNAKFTRRQEVTPLFLAVDQDDSQLIDMLICKGADINMLSYGITPLMYAIMLEKPELFHKMLTSETCVIDWNRCDVDKGWSVVHYAVQYNQIEIVRRIVDLVENTAMKSNNSITWVKRAVVDVSLPSKNMTTPLHIACRQGNVNMIRELLRGRADPNAQDDKGDTPLHYAARKNYRHVVIMLRPVGADPSIGNKQGKTPRRLALEANAKECVDELPDLKPRTTELAPSAKINEAAKADIIMSELTDNKKSKKKKQPLRGPTIEEAISDDQEMTTRHESRGDGSGMVANPQQWRGDDVVLSSVVIDAHDWSEPMVVEEPWETVKAKSAKKVSKPAAKPDPSPAVAPKVEQQPQRQAKERSKSPKESTQKRNQSGETKQRQPKQPKEHKEQSEVTKPVEPKPVEPKPAETKPVETKPVEQPKPVEPPKLAETKPAEPPKPAETKPVETKPVSETTKAPESKQQVVEPSPEPDEGKRKKDGQQKQKRERKKHEQHEAKDRPTEAVAPKVEQQQEPPKTEEPIVRTAPRSPQKSYAAALGIVPPPKTTVEIEIQTDITWGNGLPMPVFMGVQQPFPAFPPKFAPPVAMPYPMMAPPYMMGPDPRLIPMRVVRQIEFYFSEGNLVKDLYLRSKMDADGWVWLHEVLQFPAVRNLGLSSEQIIDALHHIPSENFELDQSFQMIRRRSNFKDFINSDIQHRWIDAAEVQSEPRR